MSAGNLTDEAGLRRMSVDSVWNPDPGSDPGGREAIHDIACTLKAVHRAENVPWRGWWRHTRHRQI